MRYQEIVGRLILAAADAGLMMYDTRDEIELNDMSRSFQALCVPHDWEPPFEIRAQLKFFQGCEQTAYSLYGTEGLCALYHGDEVECTHYELNPEPVLELDIEYHLPEQAVAGLDDTAAIQRLGERVREAHRECVDHENLVTVQFDLIFFGDQPRVRFAKASHYWLIEGEGLEDGEELSFIFTEICDEVHDFLLRLADLFPEPEEQEVED
jgi:hypothetical protein